MCIPILTNSFEQQANRIGNGCRVCNRQCVRTLFFFFFLLVLQTFPVCLVNLEGFQNHIYKLSVFSWYEIQEESCKPG